MSGVKFEGKKETWYMTIEDTFSIKINLTIPGSETITDYYAVWTCKETEEAVGNIFQKSGNFATSELTLTLTKADTSSVAVGQKFFNILIYKTGFAYNKTHIKGALWINGQYDPDK